MSAKEQGWGPLSPGCACRCPPTWETEQRPEQEASYEGCAPNKVRPHRCCGGRRPGLGMCLAYNLASSCAVLWAHVHSEVLYGTF